MWAKSASGPRSVIEGREAAVFSVDWGTVPQSTQLPYSRLLMVRAMIWPASSLPNELGCLLSEL